MEWYMVEFSYTNLKLYSNYLSLDPSGKIPLGTSTYNLLSFTTVSQDTLMESARTILKHKFEATGASTKRFTLTHLWLSANKLLALTGGSFETPTPLPSVTNDTLAAWGTSGTRQRPWTQWYTIPLSWHAVKKKQEIIKTLWTWWQGRWWYTHVSWIRDYTLCTCKYNPSSYQF